MRSLLVLLMSAVITVPCFAQPSGPAGTSVSAIAIDPHHPSTLFAGTTDGVYKSTNGGTTWVSVRQDVSVVNIAIDPAAASTVYVVAVRGGSKAAEVLKTTDGGVTWRNVGPSDANVVAIDSNSVPSTIYAGTTGGQQTSVDGALFKSTDDGQTWISMIPRSVLGLVHPTYYYTGFSALTVDRQTSSIYGASLGFCFCQRGVYTLMQNQ